MGKTYVIGKIGKAIKFDPKRWGATGGDNEAPLLIEALAKLHPEDKFIVLSKNDVTKVELPKNIIDIYNCPDKPTSKNTDIERQEFIWNKLKDTKIDGALFLTGPNGGTLFNHVYKRTPLKEGIKEYGKPMQMMANYGGAIVYFLNQSMIPWTLLSNDPRYLTTGPDCMNRPQKILTQYNGEIVSKHLKNFEDQEELIEVKIPYEYAGVEKIHLLSDKFQYETFFEDKPKSIKFMMVLNEGNNGVKSRYPELKKWVLDEMEDVEIYGKWDEKHYEDKRFKGPRKFEEIQKMIPKVKYTLAIPIKPGWVTSKYVEMIAAGVIPFFHPDYDDQKHLNVPDFIRLKDPEDLPLKIGILENDQGLYKNILAELKKVFVPGDFTGEVLSNRLMSEMNRYDPFNPNGKEFTQEIEEEMDEW